jgi:hypothetical protein
MAEELSAPEIIRGPFLATPGRAKRPPTACPKTGGLMARLDQLMLAAFAPVDKLLKKRPRLDMPGGKPAPHVCRASQ